MSCTRCLHSSASKALGLSLVELMISLAIGMFLITGFIAAMVNTAASARTNVRTADLQGSGRSVLEALRRDIMHAGYRGLTWSEPLNLGVGAVTGDCAAGFAVNLRQALWAANDTNPFSATCIPASNYAGGDVLVIRRAALARATNIEPDRLYLRTAYERGQLFLGSAPPVFTESPTEDRALEVMVYYVSPYSFSPNESPRVPALYRVLLRPGPRVGDPELVAPGVESLQVQFGRLTTDGNTIYRNADAVSPSATSTTTDASEWDDVNAVRVLLLLRSPTAEPGYVNAQTYTLADQTIAVNDAFRRQLLGTTIQLRN